MNYFQKIEKISDWSRLLEKVYFSTFFHSIEWENFLEKQFRWIKFERYIYKDELLLSLARYKIRGRERFISHPFCEYGGPLPLKKEIDFKKFKEDFVSSFKKDFKISFHPFILNYFKNLDLEILETRRVTYLIENFDKKGAEEIFSSFRKTLRHLLTKAEKENLKIKRCEDLLELKQFYNLYLQTSRKNKTIPYPYSFFKYFLNNKNFKIILAEYKNKIIAGSVFISYRKILHYFLNASDKKYRIFSPNHLILWAQIKKNCQTKYLIFDLGGTRIGSSLEIFKRGWGGEKYNIFEMKNYKDSLRNSNIREIFRFFPCFLMKKVNSFLIKYKL